MTILKCENISKQYRLGKVGTGTISHDLNRFWHKFRGKEDPYLKVGAINDRSSKNKTEYVWALRDINFEVQEGEVLGIIGKNGAGKSTLLKILSRVTSPTTGVIKTKGRIASLLEVGTGFHPELTGRENVFLNGAILGMTRTEITAKLDEIIEFSGCEMYIDTPVKRYSSGMTVRLAFAVAAHLEPDILVIDEVLAVGDAEFQKKAIGKMQDISKEQGRTVLFVSHNMAAVRSLCSRAILLEHGKVIFDGNTEQAISFYLIGDTVNLNHKTFENGYDFSVFNLQEIYINPQNQNSNSILDENQIIEINTVITIKKDPNRYYITYCLKNHSGDILFTFSNSGSSIALKRGKNKLTCVFPKGYLNEGNYSLDFYVIEDRKRSIFVEKDIITFSVQLGHRDLGSWMGREPGYIKPKFVWY